MGAFTGPHVRWLRGRNDLAPSVRRCLGCGVEAPMPPVVEATDVVVPGLYRRFVRCPSCGTYLMDPMDMPDYGGLLAGRLAPDPYVEAGAGVDFITMLLSAVPAARREAARLVDVGCGCGFSVHFWRSLGRDGLGVEPSALGVAGEERLGIPVVHGFAGSAPELEGRQFDVVLSSEVVEHVPGPSDFLRILASLRAPGGLVVVSTPDAAPLDEADPDDLDAWEVLSPGFHTCVLSPAALRKLCVDSGLPSVRIESSGAHLVCVAGEDVGDAAVDRIEARREYGEYLRREVAKGSPSPSVRDGLAFRLFQHVMNAGDWKGAKDARDRLRLSLSERYGDDVTDPAVCRRRTGLIAEAAEIGRHVPWFLLELHHALGILEVASGGSPDRARQHFELVADAAPKLADLDPTFLPTATSYAWNARYQVAAMALSRGSVAQMEEFLDFERDGKATRLTFPPGREILAIASAELFKSHVFARRWDAARALEDQAARLICRALRLDAFDPALLANRIRADRGAAMERTGALHAAVWTSLCRGLLRLEGDDQPGAALRDFEGSATLIEALDQLPEGRGGREAWEELLARGTERLRQRRAPGSKAEGSHPVNGNTAGRTAPLWRIAARILRQIAGRG